jgi:rhodanese-related sulfurtransferase
MRAWDNAGLPLEETGQMTVHEIKRAGKKLQLLDVRSPDEWKGGHIPNARHIFLGELREHLGKLDKTKPTAVYCDSGYRASIATSILKQEGFGDSIALRAVIAFGGGILMAFGARLAGGCTSGHGISGTLQLNLASWIAVVCFFTGGIAVAMLLFKL